MISNTSFLFLCKIIKYRNNYRKLTIIFLTKDKDIAASKRNLCRFLILFIYEGVTAWHCSNMFVDQSDRMLIS